GLVGPEPEAGGCYADHGIRFSIDVQRAIEDGAIATEIASPEPLAQDDDPVLAYLCFLFAEGATEQQRNPQRREVFRADQLPDQALGLGALGEVGLPPGEGGAVLKDLVLVLVEEETNRGNAGIDMDR